MDWVGAGLAALTADAMLRTYLLPGPAGADCHWVQWRLDR